MFERATEDTLLALADHLPAEAAEALLELATGGKPRVPQPARGGGESVRASRRAAPLPRDGERRGAGARARLSLGEMDGLPASRAAPMGRARLHRPGARLRLGGHGQDHRGAAPGRLSGPHESRRPGAAHDVLRHAGECAADEAEATARQRAAAGERIEVYSINAIGLRLYEAHVGPATTRQPAKLVAS